MKKTINERKEEVIKSFPKFDNFWVDAIDPHADSTIATQFSILYKFFKLINKIDPSMFTEDDIRTLKKHEDFKKLSNRTKNMYLIIIKKYLNYYDREDLVKMMKKSTKYSVKKHELNKIDLITKEDLDKMLEICNTKKKAIIMVLYTGALRRKELVNIKRKNVVFQKTHVDLYIEESKTIGRNLVLRGYNIELYLKEYFVENKFAPNDKIFGYHEQNITMFFKRLTLRLKKIYPDWSKELYPHLFRHSRLTELAGNRTLNEPQLTKFAGWTAGSDMWKIYFHLDDSDFRNELIKIDGEKPVKKKKVETFKPIKCKICNSENNQQNIFCWKCGNIFSKDGEKQMDIEAIIQPYKVQELKEQNKDLKNELEAMKDLYREEMKEMKELYKEEKKETRKEIQAMFDELYYRKEVGETVKRTGRDPTEVREDYIVKKQPKSKFV